VNWFLTNNGTQTLAPHLNFQTATTYGRLWRKNPKYSKYCYNAVRMIGFAVSRQFVSACKRCGKLSNSHVTHAFWFCEKSSLTRRKLICDLNDAMGCEKFCTLIRSPLLSQCRQVALFATQVENGLFVNAHLLTTLHKLMY